MNSTLPIGTDTARLPVQLDTEGGPFVVQDLPSCATEHGYGWKPALCGGCLLQDACKAQQGDNQPEPDLSTLPAPPPV